DPDGPGGPLVFEHPRVAMTDGRAPSRSLTGEGECASCRDDDATQARIVEIRLGERVQGTERIDRSIPVEIVGDDDSVERTGWQRGRGVGGTALDSCARAFERSHETRPVLHVVGYDEPAFGRSRR